MTNPNLEPFWTLAAYQHFLRHTDPSVREWAASRIEVQFPRQAAASLAPLLADDRAHLRLMAARAIAGGAGAPQHEAALLAALPDSDERLRGWLSLALAKGRSAAWLPDLLRAVAAIKSDAQASPFDEGPLLASLGWYPEREARAALWRFVARYHHDDNRTRQAFVGLLRFADPDTIPQLVQRLYHLDSQLSPPWPSLMRALAEAAGAEALYEDVALVNEEDGAHEAWAMASDWWGVPPPISERLAAALAPRDETPIEAYERLMPLLLTERARLSMGRGDDLAGWLAEWAASTPEQRPQGYRWRTLLTYQTISMLAGMPADDVEHAIRGLALALTLLSQAIADRDDEAALATPDEEARRGALLDILGSARQEVGEGVVAQVAAHGPGVIALLLPILAGAMERPFAAIRALEVLAHLAQDFPDAADGAVPPILDLFHEEQRESVLEAAQAALRAIGPAVVEPAAARLGQRDTSYEIFIMGALGEIPTPASVAALSQQVQTEFGEIALYGLEALAHPDVLPVLRAEYAPGEEEVGHALHVVATLNGYEGPEVAQWRDDARAYESQLERLFSFALEDGVGGLEASAPLLPADAPRRARPTEETGAKKGHAQAKGKGKGQRKKKKRR